ncbi:MAG: tetratricopeptide repeat protein [Promethearchaeota archaeon]
MFDPITEEVLELEEALKEKNDEFLLAIEEIQNRVNLSMKNYLFCEGIKARTYMNKGSFGDASRIANEIYDKGKANNIPLAQIDALCLKFYNMWMLGVLNYPELWKLIEESEELLTHASQASVEDIEFRRSNIDFEKACIYRNIGDIDLSLEYCIKALEDCKKDRRLKFMLPTVLMELGKIYYVKGELNISQDYLLQSLPLLTGESLGTRVSKIYGLWDLGDNYRAQGKFDLAIEVLEQALEMSSRIDIPIYTNVVYNSLIEVYIDKDSLDDARKYLNLIKEYNRDRPNADWAGKISEARILKATGRLKNLAEAEEILRLFMGEGFGPDWDLNLAASILKDLCEILLIELQITDDSEILSELESLVLQLLEIAEKQHSYTTLTSAKILQGKLALIQLNTVDARRFFKDAQKVAENHGLLKLAQSISREHDKLLDQLELWEHLSKTQTPISERLKLASMDETIGYLKARRALENPDSILEEPLMLLILSEGGMMTFSYPFESKWEFDKEIFGSFLTAFNSFSDEFFSQGLDRAKFGDDMILMQSVDTFLICYLFKGETYAALKKLNQFAKDIQNNITIWQTLTKFSKTNQVVELKDAPVLGDLITEIFVK